MTLSQNLFCSNDIYVINFYFIRYIHNYQQRNDVNAYKSAVIVLERLCDVHVFSQVSKNVKILTIPVLLPHFSKRGTMIPITELNELRLIICLRKSEVSVERMLLLYHCTISRDNIHCMPCSDTNAVIYLLS